MRSDLVIPPSLTVDWDLNRFRGSRNCCIECVDKSTWLHFLSGMFLKIGNHRLRGMSTMEWAWAVYASIFCYKKSKCLVTSHSEQGNASFHGNFGPSCNLENGLMIWSCVNRYIASLSLLHCQVTTLVLFRAFKQCPPTPQHWYFC